METIDDVFARLGAAFATVNGPQLHAVGKPMDALRVVAPQDDMDEDDPAEQEQEAGEEDKPSRAPVDPAKLEAAIMLIEAGQPITQVAEKTGISRSTLNRAMKKRREDKAG